MITLNLNKLNPIVKTHRMAKEIKKKQDPCLCCLQETHFRNKETQTEVKGFHSNGNQKKARVARIISDKTDFKTRL